MDMHNGFHTQVTSQKSPTYFFGFSSFFERNFFFFTAFPVVSSSFSSLKRVSISLISMHISVFTVLGSFSSFSLSCFSVVGFWSRLFFLGFNSHAAFSWQSTLVIFFLALYVQPKSEMKNFFLSMRNKAMAPNWVSLNWLNSFVCRV